MTEKITTCDCGDPAYGGNKQCSFCSPMEGMLAPPPAPDLPDVPYSGLEQRFFQGLNTITRRAVLQVLGGHSDAFMEQVRTHSDERRLFKHLFKAAAAPAQAQEPDHGDTVLRIQAALGCTDGGWISPDVILLRIEQLKASIDSWRDVPEWAKPASAPAAERELMTTQQVIDAMCESNLLTDLGRSRLLNGDRIEASLEFFTQVINYAAPSTGYAKFGYILQAADGHQTWLKGDPADGMGRYGKIIQLYRKEAPCTP